MDCCDPPAELDLETSDYGHQLAIRGFVALWRGQRPHPTDLDGDPATVEALQRQGRLVVDDDGRIAGIHGLSARLTPHHIDHEGGPMHTWCAFDAIGIPAALRLDARAVTNCPTCGRQLQVTFVDGEPTAEPGLRLWLPTSRCEHLVDDFCAHANLYCSDQHLTAAQPRQTGSTLAVAEAATMGRGTWKDAAIALEAA